MGHWTFGTTKWDRSMVLHEEIVKAIFDAKNKGLSIREIAKELGINKNTVNRYLKTYKSFEDYLAKTKEKEYKKLVILQCQVKLRQ